MFQEGYKGEAVGNKGLHHWIRRYKPAPILCEICKEKPPQNLANKTGIYSRDFENWFYLCIRCHRIYDGTMPPGRPRIPPSRKCELCGSVKSATNSKGVPNWYKHDNGFICHACNSIRYRARCRATREASHHYY